MSNHAEFVLLEACAIGNLVAVQQLVQSGVNVNFQHRMNGWTPLHWAIHRQHTPIIDFLLLNGADPRLRNSDLKSSLELAAVQPEYIRKVFIERGFGGQMAAAINGTMQVDQQKNSSEFKPNYIRVPTISPELRAVEQQQATVFPVTTMSLTTSSTSALMPSMPQTINGGSADHQQEPVVPKKRRSSDNLVQLSADPVREIIVYNPSGVVLGSVVISLGSTGEQLRELIIEELEQPAQCQLAKYYANPDVQGSDRLHIPISAKQMQKRLGDLFPPDANVMAVTVLPST